MELEIEGLKMKVAGNEKTMDRYEKTERELSEAVE